MSPSRREFVMAGIAGIVPLALRSRIAQARSAHPGGAHAGMAHAAITTPHPKPRAGITSAKVLTTAQLSKHPKLVPLFDSVRKIPQIIDGIRCNCGCGNPPEMYSLLSCYEVASSMALECAVCQGQAKLAARLHGEGKSLDEIRKAVDAKFG